MKLTVEADGGSRGNPGPAGYGAVVRDESTGEVLAEAFDSLGTTTNNVAEYRGLIAGLQAAADLAPGADVAVRMDSKLVVEQMSGRWQIKHPIRARMRSTCRAGIRSCTPVSWRATAASSTVCAPRRAATSRFTASAAATWCSATR